MRDDPFIPVQVECTLVSYPSSYQKPNRALDFLFPQTIKTCSSYNTVSKHVDNRRRLSLSMSGRGENRKCLADALHQHAHIVDVTS
jgi:hypothetical protein